jgi:flagellar hook assembly protein FlgD
MLGQQVSTLISEDMKAGMHTVRWNGLNDRGQQVSSGVYFYQVKTSDQIAIRKMMLVR